jgi:hypothetical protein
MAFVRPAEIKREIERLTVDTSLARAQLGELKAKLLAVQGIVARLRADGTQNPMAAEGTPPARATQAATQADDVGAEPAPAGIPGEQTG